MIGRVKIYTAGFAIFTIGSALVSTSLVPSEVIAFRALQGVGSSMLSVNSTALIVDAVEEKNLGLMLGLNTLAFQGGRAQRSDVERRNPHLLRLEGPILHQHPHRGIRDLLGPQTAQGNASHQAAPQDGLDRVHDLLLGCRLLLARSDVFSLRFREPGRDEPSLLVSFASFIAFVYQERRVRESDARPDPLQNKAVHGRHGGAVPERDRVGGVLILLSLYFQLGRSMSPLQAGLSFLPFEVAYVIVGPLSGKLSDTYGRNYFMAAGLAMQGVAVYLFSTLTQSVSFYYVVACLVFFGVGSGLFNSPNTSSVMSAVPPERRGDASGTTSAVWNVGYVMSLNVAIIIMTTVVPFSVISGTISSAAAQTSAVNRTLFIDGLKRAYLVLAGLDFVAIVPSVLRGDWRSRAGRETTLSPRDERPES